MMDAHKRYRCEDFIDNAEYFPQSLACVRKGAGRRRASRATLSFEIFVRMPKLQTHAGSSIQLRLSRCFSASTSAASSPINSRPNRCLLPGCTNHVCCPVLFSGRVALDQCLPRKNSARAPHSAWSGSVARPSLSGRPQRTMSCAYWMLRGRGQSKFSAPFET